MKLIKILALILGLAAPAMAAPRAYTSVIISTPTGTAAKNLSGTYNLARSSLTPTQFTIKLNGITGKIDVGSMTVTGPLDSNSLVTQTLTATDAVIGTIIFQGLKTNAEIQALTCPSAVRGTCQVTSSTTGEIFKSSGSTTGQYFSLTRGLGP